MPAGSELNEGLGHALVLKCIESHGHWILKGFGSRASRRQRMGTAWKSLRDEVDEMLGVRRGASGGAYLR